MKLKKNTLYLAVILVVVVIAGFVFMKSENSGTVSDVGSVIEGDVQKVVISMKNYNYYPQEIRVKAGQPVEISLDNSVVGCYRDFNIPELGLRKVMSTPKDTLVFTPKEKGRYTFVCGMRMGSGTLIVE